uniref:ABC transporter permease n=1 Tax=Lentilactobacillus hilgardii TaxID=1588 RepID=UPI00403F3283
MHKLLWRDIRQSMGRFIAISLIILLGVLIFVGVKATGPALIDSAETVLHKQQLSDVQVISDKGFTNKDVQTAEKVAGAKAEKIKFKYVLGGHHKDAVALYGFRQNHGLNQLRLVSGHLPKTKNDIVLDQRAQRLNHYKLGNTYTFKKSANLKQQRYKIVGFANSPQYIDNTTRGATNIGTGQVAYFAYIPSSQMNLQVATAINVRFSSLQSLGTFTSRYKRTVNQKVVRLKSAFKSRTSERKAEIMSVGEKKLLPAQERLATAQKKITSAKRRLPSRSQGRIKTTAALTAQQQKLDLERQKLINAKNDLSKTATPTYTWSTREDLAGFSAYGESADRIAAIANVFPVFFFLLAALITFTTVTRMVEEARMQIGTFKALGFSNASIARNYVAYALLAGILGVILGSFIGNQFLPRFVISIYSEYIFHIPVIHYQWFQILLAAIFSLVATVGAALYVILKQVNEVPASLMRPKSPRTAKSIWLEHFTWLWSKLKFYQKVSYRNLFRFKSRAIMTILGIAGGTALILTGFGISDSIGASGHLQFNQVIHYQAIVQATHKDQLSNVKHTIQNNSHYQSSTPVGTSVVKVRSTHNQLNDVNMYVPSKPEFFGRYVHLNSTSSGNKLRFPSKGIIISQKIAKTLAIKKGGKIKIVVGNGKAVSIKVAAVTKNYIGHFMYLSPQAYQNAFHKKAVAKTLFVKLQGTTSSQRTNLGKKWLADNPHVLGVNFTADQKKTVSNMSQQMTPVVLIFILLSGILSFVVLYNLTNINISERIRELSTIKVLGFFDREVTMYIARENIVLTIIGIIVGFGFGNLLTAYVLYQAETPTVVFPLTIHIQWYFVATILMILFNLIVIMVAHRHLKRVNMVEALKSNE